MQHTKTKSIDKKKKYIQQRNGSGGQSIETK